MTQLTPRQEFTKELQLLANRFRNTLPKHISIERFQSTVMTAIDRDPSLLNCDRDSLLKACQLAAYDGLILDGREAAIVQYRDNKRGGTVANYIPMYMGLLKKVRQSGVISYITVQVVHENDGFEYWLDEHGQHIKHTPNLRDRGKIFLCYAFAKLKDGSVQIEVLTMEDIQKVRGASKSGGSQYGPWAQWFESMCKKTAAKALLKWLPTNPEIDIMNHAEFEDLQPSGDVIDITPTATTSKIGQDQPTSKLDDLLDDLVEDETIQS